MYKVTVLLHKKWTQCALNRDLTFVRSILKFGQIDIQTVCMCDGKK